MSTADGIPQAGDRVVVRTPDRREYGGVFVERREMVGGREGGVVRLDTGWETTYPLSMIHLPDDR